jgi:LCP family protein required for cell wall assembly
VADDEQPPAEPAPPTKRHRRTVLKVIVATQLVVALLSGGAVYAVWNQLEGNLAPGVPIPHKSDKPEAEGPKEPLNILVMGKDDRGCAGCAIDTEAGGGGSDTTMLLHLSADRSEAYGVSLPRDAIVDRPACTDAGGATVPAEKAVMFNTAFAEAGPLCTVRMVEELTGIYIDHFIVLDFNGFKEMVDAVHGVTVCIPKEVDDPRHQIFLEAGTQEVDGATALDYVRERYVLSVTGDIGRMKRQQAFVASMVNKVMSANTLSRPGRIRDFLKAVVGSIQVDSELDSLKALADLAMQFRDTGLSDIQFITVPIEEYPEDPNRLQWTAEADKVWKRIIADRPLGANLSDDSISAAQPPSGGASGSPSGSPSQSPSGGSSEASEDEKAAAAAAGLCA